MKKKILLPLLLLLVTNIDLYANENLPLHLKIMSTNETVDPQIWNNTIFLTASSEKNPRFVGVAFDYESYSRIHPFEINENGIYVYTADAPEQEEIQYRIIIDGLWMADPLGKNNYKDQYGIIISRLKVDRPSFIKVKGPVSNRSGVTNFSIRTRPDSTVSIVGTFNGWDPYMTPMSESATGVYTTDLRLKKGDYYYYFIIDGEKAMDPMNFARAMNSEGEEVSRIMIQ